MLGEPNTDATKHAKRPTRLVKVADQDHSDFLDEFERLWPEPGVDLLAQDRDWWQNACLTHQDGRWLGHVDGYRKAARLIAMHVSTGSHEQDYLVWPFLHCWRHHTELQLKNLIIKLHAYNCETGETERPTHSISKLWARFRTLLQEAGLSDDSEIEHVQSTLVQLHRIDPSAQFTRYPLLNSGAVSRPAGLTHIHFRLFHDAMERVANYLDATDSALDYELEVRNEYESETLEGY